MVNSSSDPAARTAARNGHDAKWPGPLRSTNARNDVPHDLPSDAFAESVLSGLLNRRKTLDCKYLYDEQGSVLFDEICRQSEYYPTRSETQILERCATEIAAAVGPNTELIELGSGASLKTRIILSALERPTRYVPVDISADYLQSAAIDLAEEFSDLPVVPVVADFSSPFAVPGGVDSASRLLFFPGSTIGNFHPSDAERFLKRTCRALAPDAFVIGVDLKKDKVVLEAAYNDAAGVTAAFNLNLLERINRELDASFDVEAFEHAAIYDEARGRVEMHLRSVTDQVVEVAGRTIEFVANETIHTENSYKYSIEEFSALASSAGWQSVDAWTDDDAMFSVHLLKPLN